MYVRVRLGCGVVGAKVVPGGTGDKTMVLQDGTLNS